MSKIALARRYRPQTISQLIGQNALKVTLSNAIQSDRIAQGYLFHGPRGTGKTSTARILAKALNCEKGPTPEPCGECEQCKAILNMSHLDVTELDAASNSGVDDVKSLIEGILYAPVMGRKKVYILDEVHMLSKSAWNALLKVLEEPPVHVVFVFCTTEPRKVLPTVLSRCQRFQLLHIPTDELAAHYSEIARSEGARIAVEAIDLVAKAADGSVRDGLSILDQLIAAFPAGAGEDDTRGLLGLPDQQRINELVGMVLEGKASGALASWRQLMAAGADPAQSIKDIMERVHHLTILAVAPAAAKACGLPLEDARLVKNYEQKRLADVWALLVKAHADMLDAPNRVQAGDMTILRLAS